MADLGILKALGSSGGALSSTARTALSEAGLALTEAQVAALTHTEREALRQAERVSFGPGALDALVTEFASSHYLQRESAGACMEQLLLAFYELREDFPTSTSDQEIIQALKHAFDGEAAGSAELAATLAAEALSAGELGTGEPGCEGELAAYELVDDEGRVYRWDPDEWHDDITADGWMGERWEDSNE